MVQRKGSRSFPVPRTKYWMRAGQELFPRVDQIPKEDDGQETALGGTSSEPWTEQLDLETLERVSGSFVSLQFKRRENDVVWRVRFRGDWLYVYLLIEFQSTVDRFMALRLMVYVGLLYQRLIDEDQVGRKKLLPPVLPIVLYNDRNPWWAPQDVAELMANCPE